MKAAYLCCILQMSLHPFALLCWCVCALRPSRTAIERLSPERRFIDVMLITQKQAIPGIWVTTSGERGGGLGCERFPFVASFQANEPAPNPLSNCRRRDHS